MLIQQNSSMTMHSSGFHEFLYSIKKIREIAGFIPNQLRFHEKTLANFCDMEISLLVLPCHFIG